MWMLIAVLLVKLTPGKLNLHIFAKVKAINAYEVVKNSNIEVDYQKVYNEYLK